MSQNIERKEPTFGQPSESANKVAEQTAENNVRQPTSFSVRSNQSPGHTFTPVMQRPSVQPNAVEGISETVDAVKPAVSPENKTVSAPKLGFTFTPVEKEAEEVQKPVSEPEKPQQPKNDTASIERVIPTAVVAEPKKAKTEKIPSKYRRLLLVALLLLALLLVFFLLKPKTPATAEELQEQGSSLPIEFRPVDEEEAKRAEEEARARKAELEAQQAQAQQHVAEVQPAVENTVTAPVAEPAPTTETAATPVLEPAVVQAPVKTAEPAAPATPVVSKPATSDSVIHQAEKPAQAKATEQPAKTLKPATTAPKTEPKAQTTKVQTVKPVEKEVKATAPVATTSASSAVASKTLTVQKGVTLFQNFRDNGLEGNLSELNKMTKLNGATSRLNPGQKIIVRLDKNNRIVEMNIGSGRYIRQADGNYIYR